ncbi:glycerol kinase GlpK [Rhizosaccharibacter radicis]|uniref:Glycerol kinase n=1 Tax=Rhizosaccharibacter radicis TaxID=2782605 RepID=A0ABT1VW93_9PROT|nr:glycerol kinase GlpK [Acetobacteraceae bacterium KSS12]
MRNYLLAFDQGTTSSRALLLDPDGNTIAVAQAEFRQIFPKPGWVEHDPNEIWSTQSGVAAEVVNRANVDLNQIAAIGITNQRETAIVWDRRTGQPIYNAIVWQDRRTAGMCDRMKAEGLEQTVQERTGLVIDAYFSGTKVAWILDNVDGARAKAERGELAFGTVDSWLIWRLTGGRIHVTDETNASRTMLFNIHTREWDDEMLGHLRVPRSMLPEVKSSSEVYGEAVGTLAGVPIAGIAGDQQSALFGQMCHEPGMVKNTYGTGCFMLMNTGKEAVPSRNKLLTTIGWRRGGETHYALEGSIFIAGAVVQWLRDGLKVIRSSAEVEALASSVPDSGDVYLVPAFAGLGAPHWDPYARGAVVGMTRGTTDAHLARAALEGIAFQVVDILRAMEADAGISLKELRVDGGASNNNLLMQFQADLLGIPVIRPANTETTGLGSAFLAGLAVGHYKSVDDVRTLWKADRVFEPAMSADAREVRYSRWRKALDHARSWVDSTND